MYNSRPKQESPERETRNTKPLEVMQLPVLNVGYRAMVIERWLSSDGYRAQ